MFQIKTISRFSLIPLLSFGVLAAAEDCPAPLEYAVSELHPVELTEEQGYTMAHMLRILDGVHYVERTLDDSLSQEWLDEYFESLDPSKSFFLASDLAEFRTLYGTELDNLALQENIQPAKVIYDRYRERAIARLEQNIAIMEDETHSFDYSSQDTFPLDRDTYDWPVDADAADSYWEKSLTLSMLNLKLSEQDDGESRDTLLRRFQGQLSALKQQDERDVADIYFNALAHLYDPHTDYFSPRQSENFAMNMSLSLEGIGAVLQLEDEYTKVQRVMPGGPADKQGELQAADRIIAIAEGETCDFIDVVGWRLDEVVDKIRGEKASVVRLRVIPADAGEDAAEQKVIRIVRDEVQLEDNATKGEVIEIEMGEDTYSMGVIDVPSFYLDVQAYRNRDPNYRSTTRDTLEILRDFQEQGVDGIVIDLRGNGGGSLQEAGTMVDLFVDKGPVVQIRDQRNRIYRDQNRSLSNAVYSGPLVVLVDRLSASASEIFAGAVQDYGRGLIVGSRTFGKGTVQSVQPLPEGQIKITESKFYRITGASTQHRGVIPDVSLPNFYDEEQVGESAYDYALAWDEIRGVPYRHYYDFSPYVADLEELHAARMQSDPDLIYVANIIALNEDRRGRETISLNEAQRISERDSWDTAEEEYRDAWMIANGIDPELADAEAPSEDTAPNPALAENDENSEDNETSEDNLEPDLERALLLESGRILADWVALTSAERYSFEVGAE